MVDVIAGTSAGGINGIYLAKSLAHNLSQDGLRDLWFERGDMRELLQLSPKLPLKLRLLLLAPRTLRESPLRGAEMAQWLFSALEGMDEGGSQPEQLTSLVPPGGHLDLFVTITDFYGYDRQVPISDPRLVHDSRHRHAMAFGYGPGEDQFRREDNGGLAFAARATSCFPGVFPPVSFAAFKEWVPDAQLAELQDRCFRNYVLAGADPARRSSSTAACSTTSPSGGRSKRSRTGAPTARSSGASSTSSPTPATASSPTWARRRRRSRRRRPSRRCSARRAAFPVTSRSSTTCSRSRPTTTGYR